jgi:hypothetical protein
LESFLLKCLELEPRLRPTATQLKGTGVIVFSTSSAYISRTSTGSTLVHTDVRLD